MKFVIISPVRNEEKYISTTIKCMIQQTLLPVEWIIVDDGSTDSTADIVRNYMSNYSFIRLVSIPDRGFRKPGGGVVETFYAGFKRIVNTDYDVLSKFDGDLEFPQDTLETIARAFKNDQQLGITGGTRYEQQIEGGPIGKVLVPEGFVGGPFKFYRKECFADIGGLIKRAGWDGVDTIKANMNGWKTGELEGLKIIHLKATGMAKGEGLVKACEKYGDVSYYMGGYRWYFLLRVVARAIEARNPRVGYFMIKGYVRSMLSHTQRESKEFRVFLKKTQLKNINYWLKYFFHHEKNNG